ncbi:MAG: hypothetical protein HYW57_08385 [Ignavibacteriales bacterium]|nr:hypothetical protein [Ignavibacteriales bacterium]
MRRSMMVVLVGVMVFAGKQAGAQPKKLGVGVIIGAPTGLTIKYWNSSREAIHGYVGGGFGGLTVGADYSFHSNAFNRHEVPFYYGPGVFIGSSNVGGPRFESNQLGLGLRMMFGVDYLFPSHPFDLAFELGPALVLSPVVGVGLEGGLAFRFYP